MTIRIKVTQRLRRSSELLFHPIEVVHEFPGSRIPEHRMLVRGQDDGTLDLAEDERAFVVEVVKHHVWCCMVLEFEVLP